MKVTQSAPTGAEAASAPKCAASLGAALQVLGELEDAAAAYRSALQEFTCARAPQFWAMTQMSLGTALFRIGENKSGYERPTEAIHRLSRSFKGIFPRASAV